MKIFLESYGCTLNQADAEIIKGFLENEEFVDCDNADLVIINSCAVKNATENRMFSKIKKRLDAKKQVLVTGCLPKINPKRLQQFDVSIVDSNSLDKIPEAVAQIKQDKRANFYSDKHLNKLSFPHCQDDSVTAICEISDGCLGNCAYCGVKNARGSLKSYPLDKTVDYVSGLVSSGKKEIYLTSQDCGCYGLDAGASLAELLIEVIKIDGKFKVRVGMMNPKYALSMLDGLVELYKNNKIYKFLHVPVQSGSDSVLQKMNREYKVDDFEKLIKKFKEEISDITISTDIIVGFPTETDDDFKKTVELIKKIKPDITNISKFYPRPNTEAAKMKKLPTQTLKKRSAEMSKVCRQISLENNEKYVGKIMECLVTGKTKQGQTLARAPSYKQVILNEEIGGFITVKITGAGHTHLKAEQINTT